MIHRIRRLLEVDILQQWNTLSLLYETNFKGSFTKRDSDARHTVGDKRAIFKQTSIEDFGPLFYLLPLSIALTSILVLANILVVRHRERRRRLTVTVSNARRRRIPFKNRVSDFRARIVT